jgi:hypothetical protein
MPGQPDAGRFPQPAKAITGADAPAHRENPRTEQIFASPVPGANIVYLKETQRRQPEQPPVPPKVSEDIEFIKKTVKQSSVSVQTQKTNTAINLPAAAGTGRSSLHDGDIIRDADRQANAIADKVYNVLERRLRSERMRKGLL